ncbi:MAG: CDP-glycerol glycerophosphotransferase family protein [Clostridia bacterium]|nr:CDP-glycerol glycerophosphotransferase family protein [Clostridia bacterium]
MGRRKGGYTAYLDEKIDRRLFLLEAGQGKHANGNVFALLSCLETDDRWKAYRIILAATEDSKDEIKEKLRHYGYDRTRVVIRNSNAYKKALATAGYLVTDNSFPTYFIKREGQTYLNTWHGTPLKCLGRTDIANSTSIGNVQKNFLAADWLLFPNTYTKDIMMRDYMIDGLFSNRTLVCDYPRNDVLFDEEKRREIRQKYGLEDRNVFAYMPTWRGTGREADTQEQIEISERVIREIESCLGDDDILYVNFHFLVGKNIDYSGFEKVRPFPENLETYEFLCACDTLISDYSSVIIDFAQTGRNVIMYMYDYDEYFAGKGFYFDIRRLPFHQAYDRTELATAIERGTESYELDESLIGNHFGCASAAVLELMCEGKDEGLSVESFDSPSDKTVLYAGDLSSEINCRLTGKVLSALPEEERAKTVIGFENELESRSIEFLKALDEEIEFIRFPGKGNMSRKERILLHINRGYGLFEGTAGRYFRREHDRLFRDLNCSKIAFLNTEMYYRIRSITAGTQKTGIHRIPMEFYGRPDEVFYRHPGTAGRICDRFDSATDYDADFGLELLEGKSCTGIHAVLGRFRMVPAGDCVELRGNISLISPDDELTLGDHMEIGSKVYSNVKTYPVQWTVRGKKKKKELTLTGCAFSAKVPVGDFAEWYSRNTVSIGVSVRGHEMTVPVMSARWNSPLKKRLNRIAGTDLVCELEEDFKHVRLMIRSENVTDSMKERIKLILAFACSRLSFWHRPILLYEKDCSRYEESASVLLEKLVDSGRRDVRFILDHGYRQFDRIDNKYRKYIVDRFSFSHYYNMFAAESIFSSEALMHALEKKCANRLFKKHVLNGKKNYVFLQHGVMYMVSLDSEQRSFFRKKEDGGKQRVVVSSELEAAHFTENTNYDRKDIYICGLPKYDRNRHNDDADKIVVMTTWRPWEYVNGEDSLEQTGYYRMLAAIVSSVPEELRDRLIVLPHPLIQNQVQGQSDDPVWKYYLPGEKYDDILADAAMLITDYSSIAYDAFYRGAAVAFCWWDRDACMKEYGESAHLMLTPELAFGDVCMNEQQLVEAVNREYLKERDRRYLDNYEKIVEFSDGRNTERLISMAEKDGLL